VAVSATAPAALADTPVIEVTTRFTGVAQWGGSLVPDQHPHYAAVRSYPGGGARAGDWGRLDYCTPYGPGTAIVGYRYLLGRWHPSQGDGLVILENHERGTYATHTDGSLIQGGAAGYGPWQGAAATVPATSCIGVQVVARREVKGTLTYTVDLQRVAIQDQHGPWVGAATTPPGWVTGDAVPVQWTQGDNAFNRGTTSADVPGGGHVDLGDRPDGAVAALVPVGGLPDGTHLVTVQRSAPGWSLRTASVPFRLDRTDPATPELQVHTEAWTNADGVRVSAGPSADSGSGWQRNEFRVGDGPWGERGAVWELPTAGVHEVRVRAVDAAGRVSAPSPARVIRIDRTPPAIGPLEIDAGPPSGPRVRVAITDRGGAGVGECRAVLGVDPEGPGGAVTLADLPARVLTPEAEIDLPMRSLPPGAYDLRVETCDAAGNRATRSAAFTWRGEPAAPPAPGAGAPAPALAPVVTRSVAAPAGGRVTLVAPVRLVARRGRGAVLTGRLLRNGVPVAAGTRVALLPPRGLPVAVGRVTSGGRLVIRFRPRAAGRWHVRVADVAATFPVTVTLLPAPPVRRGR